MLVDALSLKTAVEVGVGAGMFSAILLRSKLERLYLVDHWHNPADAGYRRQALELAAANSDRVVLLEMDSAEAVQQIPNVDFVYVDTMHDRESVAAEIDRWHPKALRVLAGHDYTLWNTAANCPMGVIPAVEAFVQAIGRELFITGAKDTTFAARMEVAYNAVLNEPGAWGHNFPSWYTIR